MRTLVTCAALLMTGTLAMAQSAVVGKIEVNVVNVDVTVSSHGQPVRGLTRDDFEIFEDGVLQPLSNFFPVESAASIVATKPGLILPPSASDVATSVDERFRRKVLVVIDNVHTTTINRNRALEKLEKFVNEHFTAGEYDWSIAVAGQRLLVVLPLTSNKQAIHDTLALIRSGGTWKRFDNASIAKENAARAVIHSSALIPDEPLSVNGGRDMDRATAFTAATDALENSMFAADTSLAVRDATRAFANTTGKKIVLLISGGFGGDESRIEAMDGRAQGDLRTLASDRARQTVSLRDMLIREANASNVNLYVLNPEGLDGDSGSMYWLARETGGRVMPGNRPELSLQQFDQASSNYYSLGYRPEHGQDARYHRIKVRLKDARGYQLQYRDGYTSLSTDVQLVRLLLTPFSMNLQQPSAIAFSVQAGDARRSGNTTTIPLTARIPVKNLQFVPAASGFDAQVDVYVSIFDARGHNVSLQRYTTRAHAADDAGQQAGDLIHNATVKVTSGHPYTVVMAVRDSLTEAFAMNSQTLQF